jgi:catechol 2,3-dioxygenase
VRDVRTVVTDLREVEVSAGQIKNIANIQKLGHVEFRTTDLERARDFYVNLIGLHETARDDHRVYLRCTEDKQHHTFVLRKADSGGVGHIGFVVAADAELDRMKSRFEELGLPTRWAGNDMLGQGRTLRVQDPFGFIIDYYAEIEQVPWLVQQYHLHRGASPTRIDHVNVLTPDAQAGYDWYTQGDAPEKRVWASWLFRKSTVHDIAVMTGAGPAAHHVGFSLGDPLSIIKACDLLAGAGYAASLERGPARHGISNALFVYVRDPDGNRFELYTGDYLTGNTAAEPIRWHLNNPVRQTLWGAPPPRRWFEESMPVEEFDGHAMKKTMPALMQSVPSYVLD